MKKHVIIIMLLSVAVMYAQKKKNGTVYNEHPAIVAVEAMQQADIVGDVDKVASYLSDDFKSISGTTRNKDAKGTNKEDFLKWVENKQKWVSYASLTRHGEAYPDAIEYKEGGKVWVQTWTYLRGMHNETGVKIEMPLHNLYRLNDDNKIELAINYNYPIGTDIRDAFVTRTNGVLFNQHKNINTVRKMMGALEHGDVERGFSDFTEDATFRNLDMPIGKSHTLEEEKAAFSGLLEHWEIESIDVVGYPDYLEYEIGNGKVVQSWWKLRLKSKKDGKKVVLPIHLVNDFNDEGKMTQEMGYFTTNALKQ